MLELDHLVVAGENLNAATAHIEEALGVPMQAGGSHAVFGTHNRLLHLSDGLYLEAIAKEPGITPEQSPCWYALDQFQGDPCLSIWACRTANPDGAAAHWPEAGRRLPLARGAYRWQMFVPETGVLPYDNLFPALLSWQGPHPTAALTPQGCRLKRLIITHPDAEALRQCLALTDAGLGYALCFETGQAGLGAEIETPHGLRHL
ncbi:VOC family protein [Tritonibacter aquimaris]|uniref:VOC family protein n=1 Tax=Tritonibacter aquimaris TaxID=2663379 RepID=UPI001F18BA30|nr:VOC family protein [Tritonibacter aquimaris]